MLSDYSMHLAHNGIALVLGRHGLVRGLWPTLRVTVPLNMSIEQILPDKSLTATI
jgi:hypothetical protein